MSGRSERNRANHERWLVSYADFVTLLFAFFVVLYAFASADEQKQIQVSSAITSAFRSMGSHDASAHAQAGTTWAGSQDSTDAGPDSIRNAADLAVSAPVQNELNAVRQRLENQLSNQLALHVLAVQMTQDGLVISLREAGFFDSSSATPKQGTKRILREIATSLRDTPLAIRVEGHTDNLPIHSPVFDSNWELSTARATQIARMLIEEDGIAPNRISAAGYAGYHPITINTTPEGRAANRRVDLVVLPRIRLKYGPQNALPDRTWHRVTDN